jgi:hypothetical protein
MNPYTQYQQPVPYSQPPFAGYPGQPPYQPPYQGTPPFSHGPYQPPPGLPSNGHSRPGSVPAAPGLPQRPSFGVPQVSAAQLQQMHPGQGGPPGSIESPTQASSVDDLIANAAKNAAAASAAPTEKKAGKKDKDKNIKLLYTLDASPDQCRISSSVYAFTPNR